MKKCEVCGTAVNDDVTVCPICGTNVNRIPSTAGDKTCPACGVSVEADKKFCPNCGAKMPTEVEAPTVSEEPKEAIRGEENLCPTCGIVVAAGKKFCPNCGAKMAVEQPQAPTEPAPAPTAAKDNTCSVCGANVAANKKFCFNCGAKMPEVQPALAKEGNGRFCRECGAEVDSAKKFCPQCGSPLDESSSESRPTTKADYHPTGEAATTAGKVKQILPTAGVFLTLILNLVFMFLPFLSMRISFMDVVDEKVVHHGVPGIGVLFTGGSDIISAGARESVMRLVGAGYVALVLAVIWYILFAISSVLRYNEKSLSRQVSLSAALTTISMFLMIFSLIARVQITSTMRNAFDSFFGPEAGAEIAALIKPKWFMGAVGLFVINVIMLVYAIVMRSLYKGALDRPALTPELLGPKVCRALTVIDVIVVIVCIVVPVVIGCAGRKTPNNAKEIGDHDIITIKCHDSAVDDTMTFYWGIEYFVYTPVSDGVISVTIDDVDGGQYCGAMVNIYTYDELYSCWRADGNEGVMAEMTGDEEDSHNVRAGTKYCIVFGVESLTRDDNVIITYTFDNGGTRDEIEDSNTGNNTIQTAQTITLDSSVSTGNIAENSSKWYKITPTLDGNYKIKSTTYSGNPDLVVYDSIAADSRIAADIARGGFEKTVSLTAGRTYYLEIRANDNCSCTFFVTRLYSTATPGSTRSDAIGMTLGTSYSTGTITSDSYKWYKYTAQSTAAYSLKTTDYSGDPDLFVYSSVSSSSAIYSDETADSGFEKKITMTAGDTYYFGIKAYRYSSSCVFSIALADDATDDVIDVELDKLYSTGYYMDEKWYRFTPTTSGSYRIFSTTYTGDPDIYVYDSPNSDSKLGSDLVIGGFDVEVRLTAGRTYYIELTSYESNCSCTFIITKE